MSVFAWAPSLPWAAEVRSSGPANAVSSVTPFVVTALTSPQGSLHRVTSLDATPRWVRTTCRAVLRGG